MSGGPEPSMYLQRPSSARSQDVSHVLAQTFREYYTREAVAPDTIQYLTTSRQSDDPYHTRYVEALEQIQAERSARVSQAAMLERQIMQAQARAMTAEEKSLSRMASSASSFPDLGLPPVNSQFKSCIDSALMKKHNLLCPEDFAMETSPRVPSPSGPELPHYARDTLSSGHHRGDDGRWETPLPDLERYLEQATMDGSLEGSLDLATRSARRTPDQPLPPITAKSGVREAWRHQISADDREYARTELAHLQSKVDYLRNPRHGGMRSLLNPRDTAAKSVGVKHKLAKGGPGPSSAAFLVSPSVVTFKDYSVGQVYEMTLELKNVMTMMQPIRVLPPKSQYFSVGLGRFPGEEGLVAPGMSCHYMVRFAPDSLCDFDDTLTVQTQASALTVMLQGRREPPRLSLPSDLDVGQCLVGGLKVAKFHVKNVGGHGRFCVLSRGAWPGGSVKSTLSARSVLVPPFEVRPPLFELRPGQMTTLEVLFAPREESRYEEHLTILCDNCNMEQYRITGEGESARVRVVDIEGGATLPAPGELHDVTAQHLVKFEALNPYTYLQKTVAVQNLTNVELEYDWLIVKPQMTATEADTSPDTAESAADCAQTTPDQRAQSLDTVFTLSPQSGVLPPRATLPFSLTFAPPCVSEFHDALHLVLRNIPLALPPPAPLTAREPSKLEFSRSNSLHSQASDTGSVIPTVSETESIIGAQLEVKGACEPLSVLLQPYAVSVAGNTLVQTTLKRPLKMLNNSLSTIFYKWESYSGDYILEVEPPMGELAPQCTLDLELMLSGARPCTISHTLLCHIQHLEEPLGLVVEAHIQGPEITLEESDVNFGLVSLGTVVSRRLTLRNACRVPAQWSLGAATDDGEAPELSVSPSSGVLGPLEEAVVNVTLRPLTSRSLTDTLELAVQDGAQRCIRVLAEVQTAQVCLLSCHLAVTEAHVGVTGRHEATLLNQTLLPAQYTWGEVSGGDAARCSVTVEPPSGTLSPRQQLAASVMLTAHQEGELSDLLLPVHISGMDRPLYLAISATVRGLSVDYRTDGDDGDSPPPPVLDFGADVPLSESTVTRRLYVRNLSAISAPFSLRMEHFSAPTDAAPASVEPVRETSGKQKSLLSRTQNLADARSKPAAQLKKDVSRAVLKDGRGAAFTISPSEGTLEPYADRCVELTSYCDLWGDYTDQIICQVSDLAPVYVPVKMSVVGCPLHFQMMSKQPDKQPILRLGTHVAGVAPVIRQMRINNTGPQDVRLDWQVFTKDPEDSQLLDLIVSYGQTFPKMDADGNEVVPRTPAPRAAPRQPTDVLPDSASSSACVSRQGAQPGNQAPSNQEPSDTSPCSQDPASEASGDSEDSDQPSSRTEAVLCVPARPRVITVTTRQHGGQRCELPYAIQPAQCVVPARGSSCISVSLTPLATSDLTHEQDCDGHALGYISLDDQAACVPGKVERPTGYSVQPLGLEMSARVKPALLTVEPHDEDGISFRLAASDLLEDGQVLSQCLRTSGLTLSNRTTSPLVFRLVSAEPFSVVTVDAQTRRPAAQTLQTSATTLGPNQSATVHVGFQLSRDLLSCTDSDSDGMTVDHDGMTVDTRGPETRLSFSGDLRIEFNNNTRQHIPVCASLVLPALALSQDTLSFGTCFVGQERQLEVTLSNPTTSATVWTCQQESRSSSTPADTFCVTPDRGALDPHITHTANSRVLLRVRFTASHSAPYEAVFVFRGLLGERPTRLRVSGEGSYDGKHETLTNP